MTPAVKAAIAGDLTPFAGAQLDGTLPVRETLLNEALQQGISSSRGRIKAINLLIGHNNVIELAVRIAVGPFTKWFRPQFIIGPRALTNQGPVVVLTVASNEYLGLMWIAQVFASEYFPKGVTVDGRQIAFDLQAIPQMKPVRPILRFLRNLGIRTNPGILFIDFDLKVDDNHESLAPKAD